MLRCARDDRSDGNPSRLYGQAFPAKRRFRHRRTGHAGGALRYPDAAHGFIEEAGIVAGVAPDQAGVEFPFLQRGESAMQQKCTDALAQEGRIDIEGIDFAIKAQAAA